MLTENIGSNSTTYKTYYIAVTVVNIFKTRLFYNILDNYSL